MERGSDDIMEESPRDVKATSKKTFSTKYSDFSQMERELKTWDIKTRTEESKEEQSKSGTSFRKKPIPAIWERASSSGSYYLPRASKWKPNQDRRFDEKFDDKLRARIHEASTRENRTSSSGSYNLPRATKWKPNQDRRFDEKFDDKLRARIHEASTRENRICSPNDMEVFKQPMCLVSNEGGNELKIEERTVHQLNAITWPMIIVAVVGLYRTGKSYLMNQLARSKKGFAVGNTIEAITKGIWVLCVIHPTTPNTVLLLLDTEGFGNTEKDDPNFDNRILSLATLLCNCLVYNMKGAFDQEAVGKLTFITEMTKKLRYRNTSSLDDKYLKLILPEFVLCVKDFTLVLFKDGREITEDEYLEVNLQEQKGKEDRFNKPKKCIKSYFPVRKCFTFPPPGDGDVIRNLDTVSFDDLSPMFKETTNRFASYIYELQPKELIASKPVNGLMFTTLATEYVKSIRDGAIPDVDDIFTTTANIENDRIKDSALKMFTESITEVVLPVPTTHLEDIYTKTQQETLRYLRRNVVHDTEGKYELTTQSEMEIIWNKLLTENANKIFYLCAEKLEDAYKSLKGNIDKKMYEVAGGHRKFQRDVNRMKDAFMDSLQDFTDYEELRNEKSET